ncbi:hypothetical protein Salat_0662600 [Sesamum alatum]|uniref:Uncharacterized protein n=1 Tax=Sesamum alatum TaxID=300844 RepID=A0AAE1YRN7_9LAMI|nr:hypothetical protein Salat_0662600 [Sesamum alatum]
MAPTQNMNNNLTPLSEFKENQKASVKDFNRENYQNLYGLVDGGCNEDNVCRAAVGGGGGRSNNLQNSLIWAANRRRRLVGGGDRALAVAVVRTEALRIGQEGATMRGLGVLGDTFGFEKGVEMKPEITFGLLGIIG